MLGCSLPKEAWKLRGRIGYLGHEPLLYRDLSGRENLFFFARVRGFGAAEAGRRLNSLEEELELGPILARAPELDAAIEDLTKRNATNP